MLQPGVTGHGNPLVASIGGTAAGRCPFPGYRRPTRRWLSLVAIVLASCGSTHAADDPGPTIARVVDAATYPYLLRAGFAERVP